jgi:hypothetical protein
MDLLTILLLAAIAAYSLFTIVFFAYLTFSIIAEWFRNNQEVATQLENVAATVKTALESGETKIIQGVFNKQTGDPVKGRIIEFDELDSEVREAHRNNDVVIYQ